MTQARVRQTVALVIVSLLAAEFLVGALEPPARVDPATACFYALSLVGLALRLFWGRFLAVCFCTILAAIGGLRLACGVHAAPLAFWLQLSGHLLVVALLSGRRMQAFFEGRPSRFNRWAGVAPRLHRLRWLILAQAMVLEVVYAAGPLFSPTFRLSLLALGAAALAGLALQKTWGLLLAVALCLVEAGLVASFTWRALTPVLPTAYLDLCSVYAVGAGLLAVPLAASVVLLLPFARPLVAHLRRP